MPVISRSCAVSYYGTFKLSLQMVNSVSAWHSYEPCMYCQGQPGTYCLSMCRGSTGFCGIVNDTFHKGVWTLTICFALEWQMDLIDKQFGTGVLCS